MPPVKLKSMDVRVYPPLANGEPPVVPDSEPTMPELPRKRIVAAVAFIVGAGALVVLGIDGAQQPINPVEVLLGCTGCVIVLCVLGAAGIWRPRP